MKVSEQEFKYMTECITSDMIQLLMDRKQYSLPQAVEIVYSSNIYSALLRPISSLYFQSSGYVFSLLEAEMNNKYSSHRNEYSS